MSYLVERDKDRDEATEKRATPRPLDPMSDVLGSPHFVRSHRFANLCLTSRAGRSPRLVVSRYYWDLEPPVAIDFRAELRFGADEVEAKLVYFAARDIRYVLALDQFDLEACIPPPPEDDETVPPEVVEANRPVTAPRKPKET